MTKKKCTKCLSLKTLSEFSKHACSKDGLESQCRICNTETVKNRSRTKKGLITSIYCHQRGNSKNRGYPPPDYTLDELKNWGLNQEIFHKLYDLWVASGYKNRLSPSFDRTDDYKGYSLCRLQIITWGENEAKGNTDMINGINNKLSKAVIQLSKSGEFIAKYYSSAQASRCTPAKQANISKCCNGDRGSAGGFKWVFA